MPNAVQVPVTTHDPKTAREIDINRVLNMISEDEYKILERRCDELYGLQYETVPSHIFDIKCDHNRAAFLVCGGSLAGFKSIHDPTHDRSLLLHHSCSSDGSAEIRAHLLCETPPNPGKTYMRDRGDDRSWFKAPRGVAVIVDSSHQCMSTRGVHKVGSSMVTSRTFGVFHDDINARNELFARLRLGGSGLERL